MYLVSYDNRETMGSGRRQQLSRTIKEYERWNFVSSTLSSLLSDTPAPF